ncbi:MAG: Cobalamin biosynthesis protein CbiX [uncultured Thiotrichaceae bacterium]|uniref:Cobalamin biosynthesis protein CbiX n=1 Tax=uncultured Thiotrichaceae bacterium TaxID=298394 RepID=A0A6S6U791_9GAMM|nr:MAG: Cobalamin biosynthesis protein CbiX [uncultured Thiotrichaceae bacterium]
MPTYLLIDNGSVQASATLQLRQVAQMVSERTGKPIHPVSLMHANRIAIDQLGGQAANTFEVFLREQLHKGEREFVALPLFFGVSRALTSFVPDKLSILKEEFGDFTLRLADVTYPMPDGEASLAEVIKDHILQSIDEKDVSARAVLTDHGSPIAKVTNVRKHLAEATRQLLPAHIKLDQAVMERREGKEYDFNGDLLEDYLTQQAQQGVTSVAVIMMFFLPGRHAGPDGDVEDICQNVMNQYPELSVSISPLISEHPLLVDILVKRLHDL